MELNDQQVAPSSRRSSGIVAALIVFLLISSGLILFNAAAAPRLDSVTVPQVVTSHGPGNPAATNTPAPLALTRQAGTARSLTVVTLGDSVPAGHACGCTPFGSLVAAQIGSATGATIHDINDAQSGLNSGGLLSMVTTAGSVATDVAKADIVMIEIGANDVSYQGTKCGTGVGCYTSAINTMTHNVNAIVSHILSVNNRPNFKLVLINYWDVWEDGQVASAYGAAFEATAHNVTAAVNAGLASAAANTGVAIVDLVGPFEGPSEADDSFLLAADGDHPNAAGHLVIANAILAQVPRLLTP